MDCQKHLFNLPIDIHYLNCASRGPFTKAVEIAGIEAIQATTSQIHTLTPNLFFEPAWEIRTLFDTLIHGSDPERIAIIPSVSYGMAIVAQNLPHKPGLQSGQSIVVVEGEFPSDIYAWERVTRDTGLHIKTVPMPDGYEIGKRWNTAILEAIDSSTAMVVCPNTHWMYGTVFDLEEIGKQARKHDAWLVVDGTQSIGALPFDLKKVQPDALICASYKWLLGPYSIGLAYFGEVFDNGTPIEETWMGRTESNLFHQLTDYQTTYRSKAYRYNMGQHSNFVQLPMLKVALEQLIEWKPASIQEYCKALLKDSLSLLEEAGFGFESESWRASHLISIRLPKGTSSIDIQQKLSESNVYVSARGQGIRVSPHIYNTPDDIQALIGSILPSTQN